MIAGQGTIGLELAEQVAGRRDRADPGRRRRARRRDRDRAARAPARTCGSSASRCRRDGYTIADGIAVKKPGELTMEILGRLLDDLVDGRRRRDQRRDHAPARALEARSSRARARSGSRRSSPARRAAAGSVCAVVSGGNIDPTMLISVLRHGMTVEGRYLAMRTRLVDRPGELIRVCQLVAAERGNIVQIEHRREGVHLEVGDVGLDLTVVMRNEEHCLRLIATLGAEWLPGRAAALMDTPQEFFDRLLEAKPTPTKLERRPRTATCSTSPARGAGSSRSTTAKLTVTEDPSDAADVDVLDCRARRFEARSRAAEPDDRLHDRQAQGQRRHRRRLELQKLSVRELAARHAPSARAELGDCGALRAYAPRMIKGAFAAALTPLRDGGAALDEEAIEPVRRVPRRRRRRRDPGARDDRRGHPALARGAAACAELFIARRRGRLAVAVHCGAQTTAETAALAAHAAEAGADARGRDRAAVLPARRRGARGALRRGGRRLRAASRSTSTSSRPAAATRCRSP